MIVSIHVRAKGRVYNCGRVFIYYFITLLKRECRIVVEYLVIT